MGRAPCCEKDSVKRGPWTPEEDAKLLACIGQYGTGSWRTLPKKAGLQRCGKSCRLRWTNYLRPDLKHGRFSDQEEQLIVKLHAALGSRWSLIAAQLPGRTDNDVKNYWNTRLKKKLCEMGIDPITHKPISQLLADLAGSMTLPKGSEIAEATLGCFKDDMLNVLMRKRSDTTLIHHNINMSFAPLTLPPPLGPPNPITNSPPSSPARSHFDDHPHLVDDSFRKKPTPSPCGPVSGIRSLASRPNPSLNHSLNINDHSYNFLNHPLCITYPSSAPSKPDHVPGFSPHLSPLHSPPAAPFHHASSFNDPSSCMLDLLLDQTSCAAAMKEVPDLNLTNDHQLHAIKIRCIGPDQENKAKSAACTAIDHPNPKNHASIAGGNASPECAQNVHQRHLYTALLQQQEKERSTNTSVNAKDQERASMHAEIEHCKGTSMHAREVEHHKLAHQDMGHHNIGGHVMGSHMMMAWSPVSYTNSGSSSSNISLSATPLQDQHHVISPLDCVLTSDALLWDLSELGSMDS